MSVQLSPAVGLLEAHAPPERRGIARDGVRMLVTDRSSGHHEQARFRDLVRFVRPGDVFVVNDSGTLPAALVASMPQGASSPHHDIKIHISTKIDERLWIVEPRGAVAPSQMLQLPDGARVTVLAPVDPQSVRLWYAAFDLPLPMNAYLNKHGEPIRYGYVNERFPLGDYQTVFARVPGSAEMPSAARPFTERTIRDLRRAGATITPVTLHCGVSSFEAPERPGIERFAVPAETAELVNRARLAGCRVVAVGTTVVRALESAMHRGAVRAASGWTDLVVEPGCELQAVDGLVTGFHEAAATHVWMLRAFLSEELLAEAYAIAAEARYYKHEFGDLHAIL